MTLCGTPVSSVVKSPLHASLPRLLKRHKIRLSTNYQRNLPDLTPVPRMTLVWVTKLFSSVPMKKPLAQ
jgi:hypothetical protein